jgi:hypothetical protein
MSQSLYQEAIAEAKQLRDVAEKNAKNAIIEAVTPKIRHFIEKQLIESKQNKAERTSEDADFLGETINSMINHENNDHVDNCSNDDVVLDENAISMLMDLMSSGENLSGIVDHVKNQTMIADTLRNSLDSLSEDDKKELSSIVSNLKVTSKNTHADDTVCIDANNLDTHNSKELSEMSNNKTNETLYEVDLDEIAALLEAELEDDDDDAGVDLDELDLVIGSEDLAALGLDDDALDDLDLDSLDLDVLLADDLIDVDDEEVDDLEDEEEDVDVDDDLDIDLDDEEEDVEEDLSEVLEIDPDMLRDEIRRLKLAEAKELLKLKGIKDDKADSWGGSGNGNAGLKGAYGGTGGSKGDDFGGGKRSGEPLSVKMNKLAETLDNERRTSRSLKKKLKEYRGAVETLREQLTEMNLFNAKLLYVNKLLQNKDIAPSQRKSIIGALDDARSLREVKLLFRSLTETAAKPKNGGRLSESVARRALGSSSRTVRSASPSKAEGEVNRWTLLAGIK